MNLSVNHIIGGANRKDPVQDRVAIPAADPPDNIMHDRQSSAPYAARIVLMWNTHDLNS